MNEKASSDQKQTFADLRELLATTSHLVLQGPRESGKTSLAHHICISAIHGETDVVRIPAIIDMRKTSYVNDVKKGIIAYLCNDATDSNYTTLFKEIQSSFSSCDFLVCLDNFNQASGHHNAALKKILDTHPRMRLVVFCDEQSAFITKNRRLRQTLPDAVYIDIQPLPRKMIRELSTKKLELRGVYDKEVVDQIIKQFHSSDLPRNGYIVSLMLWAWEKRVKLERVNEAVLLKALTDHLLDSTDFAQAIRGTFDAKLKTLLLQELAHRMHDLGDYEDSQSLQRFLRRFLALKGLEFDAVDLLTKLCESGILAKESDIVTFKYRCFQEYYHALYISASPSAIAEASAPNKLLLLDREIDFITSLERTTKGFDAAIQNAITDSFQHSENKTRYHVLSAIGFDNSRLKYEGSRAKLLESVKITQEAVDDLNDISEKRKDTGSKRKKNGSDDGSRGDQVEDSKYTASSLIDINLLINLLGKVVRNAEFDDLSKKTEISKFVFRSLIQFLCVIFEILERSKSSFLGNAKQQSKENPSERVEGLMNLCRVLIPVIASKGVSDEMQSPSLILVLESIVDEPSSSFDMRLFACLFLTDIGKISAFSRLLRLLAAERSVFYNLMTVERLTYTFLSAPLQGALKEAYINTIVEIEKILAGFGLPGRAIKDRRIKQLRSHSVADDDP